MQLPLMLTHLLSLGLLQARGTLIPCCFQARQKLLCCSMQGTAVHQQKQAPAYLCCRILDALAKVFQLPSCLCIRCFQARQQLLAAQTNYNFTKRGLPALLRLQCICKGHPASLVPLHLLLSGAPAAAVRRAPLRQMLQQRRLQLRAPATNFQAATPA
jgi:hypothetical protein